MSVIDTGQVRIAWQQLGEGPDVVLVHGLAANRAFFYATLAQALRAHRRVTLFDLRGHGYSSRPETGYRAQDMAEDLGAVMDALDIPEAEIIGHSYGGAVALEFAAAQPERVRRLVMMDTRVNSLQPQQWLNDCPHLTPFENEMAIADGRDWEKEPQVGFAFLEAMARLRVAGFEARERDPFTPFGEGRSGLRGAKAFVELLDNSTALDDFHAPGVSAEALAGLDLPVQLIYGGHSRCLPSGRALMRVLPRCELATIDGAGHFFPVSHAADVGTIIARFLGIPDPRAEEQAA
jgi:pimeloyl-ACP methyl ester carboxylesterase